MHRTADVLRVVPARALFRHGYGGRLGSHAQFDVAVLGEAGVTMVAQGCPAEAAAIACSATVEISQFY